MKPASLFLSSLAPSAALAHVAASPSAYAAASPDCHCLPQDSCWPSAEAWSTLNSTVGGRLVATVPLGSPCHDPTYDEAACKALQDQWTTPELQ